MYPPVRAMEEIEMSRFHECCQYAMTMAATMSPYTMVSFFVRGDPPIMIC